MRDETVTMTTVTRTSLWSLYKTYMRISAITLHVALSKRYYPQCSIHCDVGLWYVVYCALNKFHQISRRQNHESFCLREDQHVATFATGGRQPMRTS